jgi:hypothetical protein
MDYEVKNVKMDAEFKVCPTCGYEDGFHSMFRVQGYSIAACDEPFGCELRSEWLSRDDRGILISHEFTRIFTNSKSRINIYSCTFVHIRG